MLETVIYINVRLFLNVRNSYLFGWYIINIPIRFSMRHARLFLAAMLHLFEEIWLKNVHGNMNNQNIWRSEVREGR